METISTKELDELLTAMIHSAEGISDLLFVAARPPQLEIHGKVKPFSPDAPEAVLTSARIEGLAKVIMNGNPRLLEDLAKSGSCDCSYSLTDLCRFRVNIYKQNGNFAMVLRRLQSKIPSLEALQLPPVFRDVIKEKNGVIFVTGGTGSGKTTTLAALLNEINQNEEVHVVTLEDPIEFLHPHKKATFSQRELGRDFFNFPDGLRAALRQAPKIIFVGEIRDRDTMEIALTAGETGHLVVSTLHTISASQTVNRILGMFTKDEEQQVRERLVGSLRYIVSQRLVPKKGGGRLLATELMGSNLRSREAIGLGETENRRLADIIEAGSTAGWHSFEQSLVRAYENDLVTQETALLYCINKSAMHQRLDTINKRRETVTSTLDGIRLKMDHTATKAPVIPKPAAKPPTDEARPAQ
ncbi:MAG: PilT/PilU family type 4a pilus ATPase [Verrucomicrobiae bacterium]